PAAVVDAIHKTIMRGAPIYNAGDVDGCARLYRETAESLASGPLSGAGQEALRARLLAAIRRADPGDPAQSAWELRYAFDDLLAAADRLPRIGTDSVARPPLLADVPEAARDLAQIEAASLLAAPRYLAGHADTVAAFYIELAAMLRDRWIQLGRGAGAIALFDEALAVAAGSPGPAAAATLESAFERLRRAVVESMPPTTTPPNARVGIRQSAYSEDVVNALVHAISVGAPTYNAGDIDGCARLYQQTAERLVDRLGADRSSAGVADLLRSALVHARASHADQAAWTLRRAFDAILEEAYSP
ncbi:MAG: hypothetical protein IT379_28435, partial [Deltaproteobacteria bacterium]|nr:hypothetical protein [Deltaproteobacteria bacterium]